MIVTIKTIDFTKDFTTCIHFRRDSYICSFADGETKFNEESGEGAKNYLGWLEKRIEKFPQGFVHVWEEQEIVGQIEISILDSGNAYIHLFYLKPEKRGSGLGEEIHTYACNLLKEAGVKIAKLSVSPSNFRAIRYYEKHGWQNLGKNKKHQHVLTMEKTLSLN